MKQQQGFGAKTPSAAPSPCSRLPPGPAPAPPAALPPPRSSGSSGRSTAAFLPAGSAPALARSPAAASRRGKPARCGTAPPSPCARGGTAGSTSAPTGWRWVAPAGGGTHGTQISPGGTARLAPGQPWGRWHQTGALLAGCTWVRAWSQRGRAASGLGCGSWEHRSPRGGHERQCHQQQHHASLRGHQQLPLHLRYRGTEGTPQAEQDPQISPCRAGLGVPQPPRSLLTHRRPPSPAPTPPEPPRPPLCSAHPSARMRQGGEQPPGALRTRGGRVGAGSPVWGPHPGGSPVGAPSPQRCAGAPIVCGCGGPATMGAG